MPHMPLFSEFFFYPLQLNENGHLGDDFTVYLEKCFDSHKTLSQIDIDVSRWLEIFMH